MRKKLVILAACLASIALAGVNSGTAKAADKPIRVYMDGKLMKFDVQPILEDGTTLVQFRPIFEKLGLEIGWDPETQTVTGKKNDLTIELAIDDPKAYINGDMNVLDLEPRLVGGNTFVPLRFVSEASGKEVTWVQNTSSIYLKSPAGSGNTSNPNVTKPDTTASNKGDYVYPNGDIYTGQLYNGYPEGKGKIVSAAGKTLFDGTVRSGVPWEGRAKAYDEAGQLVLDAPLKDGVYSGRGKQYESGSVVFDGEFVNGERSKGTLYYDNGDKYTGPFVGDKPSGSGKMVYKNGDVYEGDFVDGNREGKGTYTTPKGEKLVGEFAGNAINGMASLYDKKGTLLSVIEYSNGAIVSRADVGTGTGSGTLPNPNPAAQYDPVRVENDRHDKVTAEIKERYSKNRGELEDQINLLRRNNPGVYGSKSAYDKALQEAKTKQDDLLDRINALSGDGSSSAEAARTELTKQLDEAQKKVSDIYAKGAVTQQIQTLQEQMTMLTKTYTAELKSENDQHLSILKQLK